MDEEEEEIKRNVNDSKEGVDDISDSKEGVEDRKDSAKQVDVLNDSGNSFVDGIDPKRDPIVATYTSNGFQILTLPTEFQHKNYIHCSSIQPSKLSKRGLERVAESQVLQSHPSP